MTATRWLQTILFIYQILSYFSEKVIFQEHHLGEQLLFCVFYKELGGLLSQPTFIVFTCPMPWLKVGSLLIRNRYPDVTLKKN
jgi:hypothetical protein